MTQIKNEMNKNFGTKFKLHIQKFRYITVNNKSIKCSKKLLGKCWVGKYLLTKYWDLGS